MTRLRDLGRWSGGNTPSKANIEYWTNGTVPWVSPKDMKFDEITRSEDLISQSALAEGRVSLLPIGSVLIVTRSGILSHTLPVAVTKLPVTINQDIKALTLNTGISAKYVAHALRGSSQRILRQCSKHGTTVASVDTNALLDFEIPMVGFNEQEAVVAELEKQFSRLDEAVANLQRVKANLKRYKATVLQSAIDGVLIQSASGFTPLPLQELIGRISQGWSPKCDLNREALPDEWAIITTTAVQPMQYLDNQGKPLPEDLAPRPGIEIKNGDFLMTRKGPRKRAGVACLVRSTRHRLMVCDTVYRFRCDESKVQPDYLEIALNAPKVVDAIDRHKAGISESGVSLTHDKLGSVLIPLPSREAQAVIVAEVDRHLSIIREVEAEVETNLQRAQALRDSILHKSFAA
nr:restriction endonuclease subunit S [uncultured Rhodoferax sp.]